MLNKRGSHAAKTNQCKWWSWSWSSYCRLVTGLHVFDARTRSRIAGIVFYFGYPMWHSETRVFGTRLYYTKTQRHKLWDRGNTRQPTNPSHPFSLYTHGLPRLPPTTTTTAATAAVVVSARVAKPAVSYPDVPRSILLPANKPHQRDPSDQPEHETRYPPAGPLPGPATTRTAPARPSDPTPFPLALQRICNAERVTHLSSLPR